MVATLTEMFKVLFFFSWIIDLTNGKSAKVMHFTQFTKNILNVFWSVDTQKSLGVKKKFHCFAERERKIVLLVNEKKNELTQWFFSAFESILTLFRSFSSWWMFWFPILTTCIKRFEIGFLLIPSMLWIVMICLSFYALQTFDDFPQRTSLVFKQSKTNASSKM